MAFVACVANLINPAMEPAGTAGQAESIRELGQFVAIAMRFEPRERRQVDSQGRQPLETSPPRFFSAP